VYPPKQQKRLAVHQESFDFVSFYSVNKMKLSLCLCRGRNFPPVCIVLDSQRSMSSSSSSDLMWKLFTEVFRSPVLISEGPATERRLFMVLIIILQFAGQNNNVCGRQNHKLPCITPPHPPLVCATRKFHLISCCCISALNLKWNFLFG